MVPSALGNPWQLASFRLFSCRLCIVRNVLCCSMYAALHGKEHLSKMTSHIFLSLSRYHGVSLIEPPETLNFL